MQEFDVIIIGGGPAGYVAAIRGAQLGFSVACIETRQNARGKGALGGTCLNVGCIPSKSLLDSSHLYEKLQHESKAHGIEVDGARIDVGVMQKRKDKVVSMLTQGIASLFKKHGITWLEGTGALAGDGVVRISGPVQTSEVRGKHIVIATGSVPARLPFANVDNERICDSTGALAFDEVPERLGIIGAGVIGLELGSVWRRLGSAVTVLEASPDFLPAVDQAVAGEALKTLRKQGLTIRLNTRVESLAHDKESVTVTLGGEDGDSETLTFDRLIVAVGRAPNTEGLNAEGVGLALDGRGFVQVDAQFRTNLDGVFAVGDVIGGAMLAHKASEEGVALMEMLAGQKPALDHDRMPWVIYTWPEIAWVGKTTQTLEAEGRAFREGSFPFLASGRARAMNDTGGMVRVLACAKTDALLGVHIIGPNASELVSEAVLAMAFEGTAEDLARTIHAHPTLAETLHEAALAVDDRALHI